MVRRGPRPASPRPGGRLPVRAAELATLDGLHDRDLHPGSSLDAAGRAVLVGHHQSRWHGPPGLHFFEKSSDQFMTLVRDRLTDLVRDAVARLQRTGQLPAVA